MNDRPLPRPVRLEIRLSEAEHAAYKRASHEEGHASVASWLRHLANARARDGRTAPPAQPGALIKTPLLR